MRVIRYAGALSGVAAAALLVGCAGGQSAEGGGDAESQTVEMWLYPMINDEAAHRAVWDQIVEDFEADNPNVTVEYEIFPWANRDEAIQTAIAGNAAPDLIYLIPDQLVAYEDAIEPLDAYLSEEVQSDIRTNVRDAITLDGGLMGAPLFATANTLLCNAAAFERAGVAEYPTTWDDVRDMAPKFVDQGLYALTYPATDTLNVTFYPLLWQAGGSVFADGGTEIAFDGDEGLEALTFLADLAALGAIEPGPLASQVPLEQTEVAQGNVGCTWSNNVAQLEPLWGDDLVVLPPLTDEESVAYGTIGSLSMFKSSDAKDAAAAFAEFAMTGDAMESIATTAGYFSVLDSVTSLYADDPLLAEVEAFVPLVRVGELYPDARAIIGVLTPEVQGVVLGQKSPADALAAAAAAASSVMGQ